MPSEEPPAPERTRTSATTRPLPALAKGIIGSDADADTDRRDRGVRLCQQASLAVPARFRGRGRVIPPVAAVDGRVSGVGAGAVDEARGDAGTIGCYVHLLLL
ncbi:putative protein PHYTOCHROME KINASE SUBSTRATE 4 [Iris pallida]|uniref:Uncharacterized protein n=1 Tax=Iris pallida TaxID=29817 RepID=A0AAX6GUQ5_IRIPA|nr:putative protein PHYTOCHROME KINASE SUBSTRATE 4 [Iris pallida]